MHKPTIYEALRERLGREPTNAEIKADVDRIRHEVLVGLAGKGKLPHQSSRKGRAIHARHAVTTGRFRAGDVVAFDIAIEHPIAGRRSERRSGVGTIADGGQVNYSCWPPGYTVKVADSRDYKPGTFIAVTGHNLRRVSGSK